MATGKRTFDKALGPAIASICNNQQEGLLPLPTYLQDIRRPPSGEGPYVHQRTQPPPAASTNVLPSSVKRLPLYKICRVVASVMGSLRSWYVLYLPNDRPGGLSFTSFAFIKRKIQQTGIRE